MGRARGGALRLGLATLLAALAVSAPAAAKSGDIYVADEAGVNTVFRIDAAGGGPVAIGAGPPWGQLQDVAWGPDGRLYLADANPEPDSDGALFRLDPVTGERATIATGTPFGTPVNVAFHPDGQLLFTDEFADGLGAPAIFGFDLTTGASVVRSASSSQYFEPWGTVAPPSGEIFVADDSETNGQGAIRRIDPITGAITTLAEGLPLEDLTGMAREPDGKLVVADTELPGVHRIDPATGAVVPIISGPPLVEPYDAFVQPDGRILVPDTGGAGEGALYRFPAAGGQPEVVWSGPPFDRPVAVAMEPPRCGKRFATLIGSPAGDRIVGSPFADVIVGLAGKDRINGGKGKDRICGGDGKDRLAGGKGKDRLAGGKGKDRLAGGKGKDRLSGGKGKDRCAGGKGDDSGKSCEKGKL